MAGRTLAAAALLALVPLTAACGVTGGGVRVAATSGTALPGPASPAPVSPTPPASAGQPGDSPSIDAVSVLREDPGVNARIKAVLAHPCSGEGYAKGWFPIYTRYADVPGPGQIAAVDVQGCADTVACGTVMASYVYRLTGGHAARIFSSEYSGGRVELTRTGPVLALADWRPGDSCPSGTRQVPLHWNGAALVGGGR